MQSDENQKGHLLVVDDEAEVLQSIRRLFRKTYTVHTAETAEAALTLAAEAPVNVILSDQRMPGTTGVELLSVIRQRYPLMVRLIITAYTDIEAVIAAINDAHIFRYIKKPWDPDQLIAAVDDAFRFHDELARQCDLMENLQARFQNMEVRVAEKTDRLLAANEALKAVYEERDALIRSLEEEIETRKGMEAQLRQIRKQEAIGTLAGGIAHDFNNLLYPIIGFTEMALDDLPAGSPSRYNLEEVLTAADRAANLVRQILHFSRQRENKLAPTAIPPILEEVLGLIRTDRAPSIEIRKEIDPDCGPVLARPDRLKQVIMNLCTNALQAMADTGGTLTMTVRAASLPEASPPPSGLEPGRYVKLTVADTGAGIGPDLLERIFDPYFTTWSLEGCSGLGLSVALGIVQKSGGTIEVISRPGAGAAFHVYLPQPDSDHPEPSRDLAGPFPHTR